MEKAQVIKFRDSFGRENIRVVCDNEQLFIDGSAGVFLIWDDDNEMLYRVGTNNNYYQQKEKPVDILGTSYENIQYIGKSLTMEEYNNILENISTNEDVTFKNEVNKALEYYNTKYNYKK